MSTFSPLLGRSALRRAFYAALALLALLVGTGGALWYFSYGVRTAPPAQANVAGLSSSVEIAWNGAGVPTIRADSASDRYAALGYAHGTTRPWMVALWRQTATGRLGEWYGDGALPLDRLTRRLGFAELARQTYEGLAMEEKAMLRAYTQGMNASLQSRAVRNRSEFSLLGQTPDPWRPWHTLAIERLYAYLAHQPPALDSLRQRGAPQEALRFLRDDRALRRWLRVHDLHRSAAWAVRSGDGATHLFYRHAYGSSAIPPLQAVLLRRPTVGKVAALSLPGTPFLVAGRAGDRAWALLPGGTLDVERARYDTSAAPSYERALGAGGNEHLVTVRRSPQALLLGGAARVENDTTRGVTAAGDSLPASATAASTPDSGRAGLRWQVRWDGFRPGTDLSRWQALARGDAGAASSFQLLRAGGIVADSAGTFERFGTPARTIRFADGLVAGPPDWTPSLAEQVQARLDQRARDSSAGPLRPARWVAADSSTWAARLAPDLLASVDSLSRTRRGTFTYEERTDAFGQAIRYLRNWDFAYDGASIGASIFDTWVQAYRRETSRLPVVRASVDSLTASDSLRVLEDRRRFRLLGDAVSRLADRYGDDAEAWRWERVAPDTRYFPGWNDSLATRRLRTLAATRYAPIELPGSGHPSTLDFGSSPISPGMPAPAAYEAWLSTNQWQTFYVRRRRFETGTPFGRYRAQRTAPDPLALRFDAAPLRTTLLRPDATGAQPARAVQAHF